MKVFSYNVNGIRAAIRKGFNEWLAEINPDILSIQELKATPDQFDGLHYKAMGYHAYWMPAIKKGYSGVGLLSKTEPEQVIAGMGNSVYDQEGRVLRADFKDFTLICSYFPSGTTGDIRQEFKMQYLSDFSQYIAKLKEEKPRLIISGDFNICHKPIDINHPERHKKSSGFLPEERAWFDSFIGSGFVDSFRMFNSSPGQYSWWSYRANSRAKNLGWRIDYNMVSQELSRHVHSAGIMNDAYHSDHCPVWLELKTKLQDSNRKSRD